MLVEHGDIKFLKNLLIFLLYIIIIPVILYDVFLIAQMIMKPGKTPDFFGYKTFTIISGSMQPTIDVNDLVIVKNVEKSEIKVGDIVTYNIENETVTHRVIQIDKDGEQVVYTTKGDGNDVTDISKISYEQIEGKYVWKIPKVGKIYKYLKNRYVFGGILIILLLCYLLQKRLMNKKIERKEKREEFEKNKRMS